MSEVALESGTALVLVADAARARLLVAHGPGAALEELDALFHPEARMHENDLVEDVAGRRGHEPTQAKSSRFGGQRAKDHRNEEFAGLVCEHLERAVREHRAARVYLIADPSFLGLLRMRLNETVRHLVRDEVTKRLADDSIERIRSVLPPRL